MNCSRCGGEAAVKRESAYYCGKCAVARDWEQIIDVVQSASTRATVTFDAPKPAADAPNPAADAPQAAPPVPAGAEGLPADPFA